MRPKRSARRSARQRTATIRRDAAGIDIGARRIHVAVDHEGDVGRSGNFKHLRKISTHWQIGSRPAGSDGRDGVDRSVLDRAFSDSRDAWTRGMPRQRASREARAWPEDGYRRLPIAAVFALWSAC
jgi:hypothetical protein